MIDLNIPKLYPLLLHRLAISLDKNEVQNQVRGDQCGIEHIQPDDNVSVIQQLVDNAENVAQNNERHEDRTLADHHFRAQRSHDGNRPADCETEQKQYLLDAK